jgi:ribosomal protein L13
MRSFPIFQPKTSANVKCINIEPYFIEGQRIVVVRCEDINISGNFYRNKCKLKD